MGLSCSINHRVQAGGTAYVCSKIRSFVALVFPRSPKVGWRQNNILDRHVR